MKTNLLLSLIAFLLAVLAYMESPTVPPFPVPDVEATSEPLFALRPEEIAAVRVSDRQGCFMVRAAETPAQEKIGRLFEAVTQARVVRRFAPPLDDLSAYGLTRADRHVEVWRQGSEEHENVTVGHFNPIGNAVYARLGNGDEVLMVGSYFLTALDMAVQNLRTEAENLERCTDKPSSNE
jgi:hypothetical protein